MTSDRQRALIERLLSEAEEAVVAGQWDVVARHAQSVLALEPSNPDGLTLNGAAERMGAAIPTQVPPRAELLPDRYSVGRTSDTSNPNDTDPELRMEMARSLLHRGQLHDRLAGVAAAIADVTTAIENYSDDPDPAMCLLVEKTLDVRGAMQTLLAEDAAAIVADYTSVIETYRDDTNPHMRQQMAQALFVRGRMNWMQGDFDRATADYTSIIETYSDDPDPHMRQQVEAALEWVSKFAN